MRISGQAAPAAMSGNLVTSTAPRTKGEWPALLDTWKTMLYHAGALIDRVPVRVDRFEGDGVPGLPSAAAGAGDMQRICG
jgi:hypothetical protein